MGNLPEPSAPVEQSPEPSAPAPGWGPVPRLLIRFVFAYWLLYSLALLLMFPTQLAWKVFAALKDDAAPGDMPRWLATTLTYLNYPGAWFHQGMNWFTPRVSHALLGLEVAPPAPGDYGGSGDRLYNYCTCFAYLVLAPSPRSRRAARRTSTSRRASGRRASTRSPRRWPRS